jgi:hypothetical protein
MAAGEESNGGAPPRVDPTKLTTEAVNAAKEDLRREMESIRLLAETNLISQRTEVMGEIRRVSDVTDQKFNAVDQRFEERDTRTEQAAQESRISLDAALAAAKEAVGEQNKSNALSIAKSEVATQKQIDALVELFNTRTSALDSRLNDIKERQDKGQAGIMQNRYDINEGRLSRGQLTATVSAVFLGIAIIVSTLVAVLHP